MEARVHEIEPRRGWRAGLGFGDLWRFRDLGVLLALRDVRLRYRQTLFGVGWALLRPIAATVVFSLLFGSAVGLASDGLPYDVFVFAALILWWLLATGVESASISLVEERELVTRVWYPRLLSPLGAIFPSVVDLAISLPALAVLMAIEGVAPDLAILTAPLWIVAAVVLAAGIGSLLCALNVQYRDVKYTLSFMVQLWFFASPIIFASSVVDGAGRWALAANPLCGLLDGWRWALLDGPPPPQEDLLSLATGLLLVVGGILYFRSTEARFADVI